MGKLIYTTRVESTSPRRDVTKIPRSKREPRPPAEQARPVPRYLSSLRLRISGAKSLKPLGCGFYLPPLEIVASGRDMEFQSRSTDTVKLSELKMLHRLPRNAISTWEQFGFARARNCEAAIEAAAQACFLKKNARKNATVGLCDFARADRRIPERPGFKNLRW